VGSACVEFVGQFRFNSGSSLSKDGQEWAVKSGSMKSVLLDSEWLGYGGDFGEVGAFR